MVPRTFPSSLNLQTKQRQLVALFLGSVAGLQRWVDYIPVNFAQGTTLVEGSYDNNGFIAIQEITSGVGLQAFLDYIPVFFDSAATDSWRVSDVGFIPYGNSGVFSPPSLDLSFTRSDTLDPRITFTRATTATYYDQHGVLSTDAINVPRFDYNPITFESLGLLIEEQRTNLMTFSDQFDNVGWLKSGAAVTANTVVSPNGTVDADQLVENDAPSTHSVGRSVPVVANTAHTTSFHIKAIPGGASRFIRLQLNDSVLANTGVRVAFDVSNGTIANAAVAFGTGSGATASVVSVGNGWHRCSLSGVIDASSTSIISNVFLQEAANFTASYTGDGFSGIFIWGAQLEVGAFPTSYIPTVASQVTRAADSASMTGANFSSWYNQGAGTLYAEAAPQVSNAAGYVLFEVNDATAANRIGLFKLAANGNASLGSLVGGVTQAFTNTGAWTVSGKFAGAYAVDNFASVLNGGAAATDTSGTLPVVTQATIGVRGDGAARLSGTISKISYYPQRLSNAQLQALTS